MKFKHKCLSIGLLALLVASPVGEASAQQETHRIEIDGTIGTRIGGELAVDLEQSTGDNISGRVSADTSASYGGIVGMRVQSNGFVFLSYSRQDTTIRFRPSAVDLESYETQGSIEYLQVGGNLEATRGRLTPYFGFSIGAGHFASHEEDAGDAWRFTAALDGGLKLRILPALHLRLLGRVPFTFSGGELYCYTGIGCAVVVNNSPFVQGEVQGGIGLAF